MNDTVLIISLVVIIAWLLIFDIIIFSKISELKREIKKLKENQLSIISHFDTELLRKKDSQK